ncbi:hypothetical protein [Legionella hackeliae]|uniref:Uncharacterized protein n=1 Tax=Legionella hackeliae TaxID=449 RepID=A0A0A8UK22_LEGHA|nr:hypothetical protein [Legionella hackeliae]KTD12887.1 hypothetical protein Lhac_1758 [Legionella hackeliae]CEK09195.1 conserved protein of unknown function [Legionella hackeliae]STX49103.1 Uncharacterised protein [Legionella hackeliae]
MKFFVTHCVLDRQVGSNPLGHSCILLSQLDEADGKIEVIDQWGFYGVPTTGDRNSFTGQLKITLGLDVDLQGNHGMLRHEEIRFLDMGRGLHGTTFELSEENFRTLQKRCADMARDQENAIREIVEPLGLKGKSDNETRIYSHEKFSTHIFALEKERAKQEGRPSRLKPFEFNLSMTFWGPDLNQSFTCKSQAVSLLEGILTPKQLSQLTVNGKHRAVPRYSGKTETIFLHSSGPLRKHTKHSGEEVYYRDLKDEGVKLYWTLPPQELEVLSPATTNLLQIPEDYRSQVKSLVSRLQRLEWLFINAELEEAYNSSRHRLIDEIRQTYGAFSKITNKKEGEKISGWYGYFLSLLSAPRDANEAALLQKIKNAQSFLNCIYIAVVDSWEIEDTDSPEAVAAYLSVADKKALCSIVGRSYLEPEKQEEAENLRLEG